MNKPFEQTIGHISEVIALLITNADGHQYIYFEGECLPLLNNHE